LETALANTKGQGSYFTQFRSNSDVAHYCNLKKFAAKKAQEKSEHLFLCLYLKRHPMVQNSIVLEVSSKTITVFCHTLGITTRFYVDDFKKLGLATEWIKETSTLKIVIDEKKELIVSPFSQLAVEFSCSDTWPLNIKSKFVLPK
jgi:DIS3-like exonuclease 2